MKAANLFAPFALLCALGTLVGCATTERRASESALDEKDLRGAETPLPPVLSQQVTLDESAFGKLDLDGDGPVNLEERQRLDTSARTKEDFSALDENLDDLMKLTASLSQVPKHSKRYHFFWDKDKTNDSYVSWNKESAQQPGWQLFSFDF
jgi:hypothetical protein